MLYSKKDRHDCTAFQKTIPSLYTFCSYSSSFPVSRCTSLGSSVTFMSSTICVISCPSHTRGIQNRQEQSLALFLAVVKSQQAEFAFLKTARKSQGLDLVSTRSSQQHKNCFSFYDFCVLSHCAKNNKSVREIQPRGRAGSCPLITVVGEGGELPR